MRKGFIVLCLIVSIFLASTIASVTASNVSRKHKKISPLYKTRALEAIRKKFSARIETNYLMKGRLTMLSLLRFILSKISPPAYGCRTMTCVPSIGACAYPTCYKCK